MDEVLDSKTKDLRKRTTNCLGAGKGLTERRRRGNGLDVTTSGSDLRIVTEGDTMWSTR